MLVKKKESKYLYNNNFSKILREMNLYGRVLHLMRKRNSGYERIVELAFSKDVDSSELGSIFVWAETEEGHLYWENVDNLISIKLKQKKDNE